MSRFATFWRQSHPSRRSNAARKVKRFSKPLLEPLESRNAPTPTLNSALDQTIADTKPELAQWTRPAPVPFTRFEPDSATTLQQTVHASDQLPAGATLSQNLSLVPGGQSTTGMRVGQEPVVITFVDAWDPNQRLVDGLGAALVGLFLTPASRAPAGGLESPGIGGGVAGAAGVGVPGEPNAAGGSGGPFSTTIGAIDSNVSPGFGTGGFAAGTFGNSSASVAPGISHHQPAKITLSPLATDFSTGVSTANAPDRRDHGGDSGNGHGHGRHGQDPLWVLDANKAITVTPGVTEHEFSNWSMSLMAQVSGATVSSYSWNTNSAPDASSISGASTYNLTFTWANFTGAARTDTISVTETPTSGSPITQTLTFLVNSTSSPAYTSTPPTSSSTWPTVLTPDALTEGQATMGLGPYYELGLAAGDIQTVHPLPAYNPDSLPLGLAYSSAAANPNPQPIFLVHYPLSASQSVPSTVSAQLTLNNVASSTVYYNTSQLNPGDIMEIALQPSNTGLTTGRYSYSISVTANSTTTYTGSVDIINNSASVFGAGWSLAGLERIWSVTGGVILDEGAGLSLWFASTGGGNYTTPPGDTSTLVLSGSTYTRTLKNGIKINFNSSGLQTSIVDTNNNTWTDNYNGSNQLTSITDPYNLSVTFTYTAGLVTSITDPANRIATLTYSSGQLASIKDPDNGLWQYSYGSGNNMTVLTNPRNYPITFTYNSAGWVTSVSRPDSATEQLSALQSQGLGGTQASPATPVLAAGVVASYTDPRNNVWQSRLDWLGFGGPAQPVDALGNMSLIYRDANGLTWLTADPLARRHRFFYDSLANPTKMVLPDDRTRQFTYNGFSEPLTYTDPASAVTTFTYDTHGNLTQLTDALSHVSTSTYDSHGFLTSVTDPLSHMISFAYDTRERLTNRTDALGHVQTYTYDSASNQTSSTNELGYTTTYTYDGMDRLLTTVLPITGSPTITYTYDAAGNRATITDPDNNTTSYGYDSLNRMTTMTDALNHSATYSHDSAGNLSGVTDRNGRQRTFTYDADGRRTNENWLGSQARTITYAYDVADQLTSESDPNSAYAYTYDVDGRLTSVDNNGTPSVPHVVLTYAYDQADNRVNVTDNLSSAGSIAYSFDAVHRMTTLTLSIAGSQTAQVTFSYDSADRMTGQTRSTPGGTNVTANFGYDSDDQTTGITYTAGTTTLASFTYTYDNAGEVSGYTGPEGTLTYAYDQGSQLTSGSGGSFSYDANGNRKLTGYVTGADNRLTNDGTYTYTYDNEGNMLTKGKSSDSTTYSWDYWNRLTEVVEKAGVHSATVQDDKFTYDVKGRRIGKSTLSGGQSWTFYDGDNTYADFNSSGSLTKRYFYGQAIDKLFARVDSSGNVAWYLTDLLGSARVLTDKNANVLDQITYDSYGNIVSETSSSNGDRFKFTGREWDSEIALYYYRARYYNPAIGRFITEDPSGFGARDSNLYRYVGNDPTGDTDPTGLWRRRPCPCPPPGYYGPPPGEPGGYLPPGSGGRISFYQPPGQPETEPNPMYVPGGKQPGIPKQLPPGSGWSFGVGIGGESSKGGKSMRGGVFVGVQIPWRWRRRRYFAPAYPPGTR